MENFKNFELPKSELIWGGELEPTYCSPNGNADYYDEETGRYIFF